jgi:hypothetical protein
MKAIIFDSGTLITLSMSGLLDELRELKKKFDGKFMITSGVRKEIVEKPIKISKFKLGALRLKQLIDDKVLEFPEALGLDIDEINRKEKEILNISNRVFFRDGYPIKIIDMGEASCLALSEVLSKKGIKNIISIDERTTRVFCEKPENLRKLLEVKLHAQIKMGKVDERFANFKFVRSTEVIYMMFVKKIIENQSKEMLDALLYSAKYKGCAVSSQEIKEIEKLKV